MIPDAEAPFDWIYVWGNNGVRKELKGKRCRVLHRGARLHSVLVEFEDGQRVITSARAIRKEKRR